MRSILFALLLLSPLGFAADEPPAPPPVAPAPADSAPPSAATPAAPDSEKTAEAILLDSVSAQILTPDLIYELGGTVQLKAFYHDMFADRDIDKQLSFMLRRLRIDLKGELGGHFGFLGEFGLQANEQLLSIDNGYLYYSFHPLFGIRGGKQLRPFSQGELQNAKSLYTIEKGELYQDFLARVTGYASYDLGLVGYGGFVDDDLTVGYEVGIFNGKQNNDPLQGYAGQQFPVQDKGLKAKDAVFRLTASPVHALKLEAALSTKAAEDVSNPADFSYGVNTAYEVAAAFATQRLRLMGEVSWGDNQQGRDALILSGSTPFFAFYALAVWHEAYTRGRASELVLKIEGVEPDSRDDSPNDGKLLYTLGCNYFFTPRVSVMADYSALQPVTEVPGEGELIQNIDLMWRASF